MLAYERLTIEFYSAPRLSDGGKPFVTTPEQSTVQIFEATDDFWEKRPENAYAFRMTPVVSETTNKGLKDDEHYYAATIRTTPLMFLGGVHLNAEKIADVYADDEPKEILKNIADEFILTADDVLVPFDPKNDVLMQWDGNQLVQAYPAPSLDDEIETWDGPS